MCRFQTIKCGGNFLNLNAEKTAFLMATNNLVRSTVRWIERFVDSIMANKNVSACRKIGWYM